MAVWGGVALVYSAAMLAAALFAPVAASRRILCAAMAIVYGGIAWLTAPLPSLGVQLGVPGGLLLAGYWMPRLVFGPVQPGLEAWLMRSDRWVFTRFAVAERLRQAPRLVLEGLEACYLSVYLVVGGGAIYAAFDGAAAVARYWNVVLAAELFCYVLLPWLRSRPPRALEPPSPFDEPAVVMRRVNLAVLGRASVQANTLPSGHVAGAMAAALALSGPHPLVGAALGVMAFLIAIAAVTGRYHYVVDVLTAAVVGLAAWSLHET
jgi:membrane-associated phospholipid phosphatase